MILLLVCIEQQSEGKRGGKKIREVELAVGENLINNNNDNITMMNLKKDKEEKTSVKNSSNSFFLSSTVPTFKASLFSLEGEGKQK